MFSEMEAKKLEEIAAAERAAAEEQRLKDE